MNKMTIDFGKLAGRVYIGRSNGTQARRHFKVANIDNDENCVVTINFPENAKTISSSFFLAMFGESIEKAGSKESFEKRFKFNAKDHIKSQINQAIDRAIVSVRMS